MVREVLRVLVKVLESLIQGLLDLVDSEKEVVASEIFSEWANQMSKSTESIRRLRLGSSMLQVWKMQRLRSWSLLISSRILKSISNLELKFQGVPS